MNKPLTIPSRAAGILLPISSLPSPYGIGTLGKASYDWIDFLSIAGQQYWQVLPLGPTSYGDSPYQSFSAFAGNPYFIDLKLLRKDGLLDKGDYAELDWGTDPYRVNYGTIYRHRESVLRKAMARFSDEEGLRRFCEENAFWLEDYALYMAIKATQGHRSWTEWEPSLRYRRPEALTASRKALAEDIRFYCVVQYLFFRQWTALRAYAQRKGVQIIGDIPIYVAMDSADVWARPHLFQLDEKGLPSAVAGCPPDSFSATGQLWGNPLYAWEVMEKDGFRWWIERCKASFALYDVLRIDHFRGLESYYAIPYGDATAQNGKWMKGPGRSFLQAIREGVPDARIIAEDLGFLTDEVRELQRQSGYPGMKVLLFAFDTREDSDYLPYNYTANSIVYTGTHDNDTILGWSRNAPWDDVQHAMAFVDVQSKKQLPRALIRLALSSCSSLAVVPLQDWLELDDEARMNIPSTLGGNNWRWRVHPDLLTDRLADEIRSLTRLYGRLSPLPSTNISLK